MREMKIKSTIVNLLLAIAGGDLRSAVTVLYNLNSFFSIFKLFSKFKLIQSFEANGYYSRIFLF